MAMPKPFSFPLLQRLQTRTTPHQPLPSLPIQSCRFLRPHLPLILFNLVWCAEILWRCGGCEALLLAPVGRWIGWEWPHQFGSRNAWLAIHMSTPADAIKKDNNTHGKRTANAEAQTTSLVCIESALQSASYARS